MRTRELIKFLQEYPDLEVTVSVDISTEESIERRTFGNIMDVMQSGNELVLLAIGHVNDER